MVFYTRIQDAGKILVKHENADFGVKCEGLFLLTHLPVRKVFASVSL